MIVRIYLDAKSALDQYRRHTYPNPISLGFQQLCFLSDLLDERNPIDLVEGRLAREYFFYGRFAERRKPFLFCLPADLRTGSTFDDHLADLVGHIEKFVDGGTAAIAGVVAGVAADVSEEFAVRNI